MFEATPGSSEKTHHCNFCDNKSGSLRQAIRNKTKQKHTLHDGNEITIILFSFKCQIKQHSQISQD